jgi:hypothetical protein
MSYSDYVDPQALVEHYNHNIAWETEVSRADQAIHCAPGGRIKFFDHMPEESCGTLHHFPFSSLPSPVVAAQNPSTWTTADFSPYIPYGTRWLFCRCQVYRSGGAVAHVLNTRPKGSTDTTWYRIRLMQIYIGQFCAYRSDFIIECSQQGEIEYYLNNTVGDCWIELRGYFI